MSPGQWIRFLSGPDIDGLNLTSTEIVAAVQGAVLAHGRGRALVEPRVHLTPDNDGAGHFNVLRGHLPDLGPGGVSGIKVVGDFVINCRTHWSRTRTASGARTPGWAPAEGQRQWPDGRGRRR